MEWREAKRFYTCIHHQDQSGHVQLRSGILFDADPPKHRSLCSDNISRLESFGLEQEIAANGAVGQGSSSAREALHTDP
jgi:hypothetical protein